MNWGLSNLDKYTLISNSDSHSPSRIGREANALNVELNYNEIINAIKFKDKNKFLYTIEFFPQEGKYHYDGHRKCGVNLSPKETRKYKNLCPVCGRNLTKGVMHRVEYLADREEVAIPLNKIPFKNLVPLEEIISETMQKDVGTITVKNEYENLIKKLGTEFDILINKSYDELKKSALTKIAEGIIRVRERKVKIIPGYDGVYGKVKIFDESEKEEEQMNLF
jgi:uncharacterized protein (TIGR00375 family)